MFNFYRELPEIARHYVIRILFVEQPVPQAVVASWVSQAYAKWVPLKGCLRSLETEYHNCRNT